MLKFVQLFTDDFAGARGEIEALGGSVTQKFTDRVFEATLPDDAGTNALLLSSATEPANLDEASSRMAAAWSNPGSETKEHLEDLAGDAPGWSTWVQFPGSLMNVSAAADGTVWGVDRNGVAYKLVCNGAEDWQAVPAPPAGSLIRVAAGSAGNVWAVNSTGIIYRHVGGDKVWEMIPGRLTDISVAADGAVWGLDRPGNSLRYKGPAVGPVVGPPEALWDEIGPAISMRLNRISVASVIDVWSVDSTGKILKYVQNQHGWTGLVDGPALTEIGAAYDGTVWGLDSAGKIYKYNGNRLSPVWQQIPGALTQISVGGAKIIWGVNSADDVYLRVFGGK